MKEVIKRFCFAADDQAYRHVEQLDEAEVRTGERILFCTMLAFPVCGLVTLWLLT